LSFRQMRDIGNGRFESTGNKTTPAGHLQRVAWRTNVTPSLHDK